MSSMGMDFFTNSRGRSIPRTPRYAQCTRSILLKVKRQQYLMAATMAQARRQSRQRCWRFDVRLLRNAPNDEQEGISIKKKAISKLLSPCFRKKCRRQEFLLHTQKEEMPTTKFVRWRVLPRSGKPQLKFHVIRNRFLSEVQHFILCIVI